MVSIKINSLVLLTFVLIITNQIGKSDSSEMREARFGYDLLEMLHQRFCKDVCNIPTAKTRTPKTIFLCYIKCGIWEFSETTLQPTTMSLNDMNPTTVSPITPSTSISPSSTTSIMTSSPTMVSTPKVVSTSSNMPSNTVSSPNPETSTMPSSTLTTTSPEPPPVIALQKSFSQPGVRRQLEDNLNKNRPRPSSTSSLSTLPSFSELNRALVEYLKQHSIPFSSVNITLPMTVDSLIYGKLSTAEKRI